MAEHQSSQICYVFKDNSGPVHPDVWERVMQTNSLAASQALEAYGSDSVTSSAIKMLNGLFGERARVFFTPTGTFANTLGCSLIHPEEGILITPGSHLVTMERGGPKTLALAEFIPMPSKDGKFDIDALEKFEPGSDRSIRMVHVTQPTEYGTLYSVSDLRRIGEYCSKHHLLFGLDGARLPHAVSKLGVNFKTLTTEIGVDFVTLGVAKIGGMHGNALILIDPEKTKEKGCIIPDDRRIYHLIKLRGGTQSRIWEVSAQFLALFEGDLWERNVSRAMRIARSFSTDLQKKGIDPAYPVDSNAVFLRMGEDAQERLGSKGWHFYSWHEDATLARFMFPFNTPMKLAKLLRDDIVQIADEGKDPYLRKKDS